MVRSGEGSLLESLLTAFHSECKTFIDYFALLVFFKFTDSPPCAESSVGARNHAGMQKTKDTENQTGEQLC